MRLSSVCGLHGDDAKQVDHALPLLSGWGRSITFSISIPQESFKAGTPLARPCLNPARIMRDAGI